MAIITVISFKGGVGKSMLSQNIGVYLALKGRDVCIADADPTAKGSLHWHKKRPNEQTPVDVYHIPRGADLIKTVNRLNAKYEIVIIDCPPAIEKVTSSAVAKSDFSLIPVSTKGGSDSEVLRDFLDHLELLRARLDAPLPSYIVVNQYRDNYNLHQSFREVLDEFSEEYNVPVIGSIAERVAYGEASALGLGVLEWQDNKAKSEIKDVGQQIEEILANTVQPVK